jgi:hypothetical protein
VSAQQINLNIETFFLCCCWLFITTSTNSHLLHSKTYNAFPYAWRMHMFGTGSSGFTYSIYIYMYTVKPLFDESLLGDWFFLHFIEVFTKWGLCKITSKTSLFTHIHTVQFYMIYFSGSFKINCFSTESNDKQSFS